MQPETAKAILVAVSGNGQKTDRGAALKSGFNHHFAKPIDCEKLASLLAGIDK
jgi:CheY-like chemotaxis protein